MKQCRYCRRWWKDGDTCPYCGKKYHPPCPFVLDKRESYVDTDLDRFADNGNKPSQEDKMKRCPRCGRKYGRKRRQSNHHIYPRSIFGVVGNNQQKELCRQCHDELHDLIREMEKQLLKKCKLAYLALFNEFMSAQQKREGSHRL